jgi:hypothetical protein
MEYSFVDIVNNEFESIQELLGVMCKKNKINQYRQDYRIIFSSEKIFVRNNGVRFTSGSKKYLSFYGKIYLNKNGKIIETVHIDDKDVFFSASNNSLLMISGGISNSTVLEYDQEIMYFYIAPKSMLELQDIKNWQKV